MSKFPLHLLKLMECLKRFPGVGNKSAERFAFQMLEWNQAQLHEFAELINQTHTQLKHCDACGCLKGTEQDACRYCTPTREQSGLMCVIAYPKDVFAIEETREYRGLYHVLGGVLSPLDGRGPEHINIQSLKDKIKKYSCKEVILALDSTLEGDATSLFIKKEFYSMPVSISRLAFGLPMGSSFDYVDGGTLARAFSGRAQY